MITEKQYQLFLTNVTNNLEGEWVVIGGSMLAMIGAQSRATVDIDLCTIGELTNERRIGLMEIAVQSGLSIEAINPAADFFLKQIPNWKSSIVLFRKGSKGALYRPSLELYFKLKLARGSDTDLQDCLAFLNWHKAQNIAFDKIIIEELLRNSSAVGRVSFILAVLA